MFELPNSHVIQILGADAEKVVNNLCTNDIKKLAVGTCCEAFITNVRGWCVEHGFILKLNNEILVVGQFGNPAALCSHIDRYIIREDAKITDLSRSKCVFLLSEEEAEQWAECYRTNPQPPAPSPFTFTKGEGEARNPGAVVSDVGLLSSQSLSPKNGEINSAEVASVRVTTVSVQILAANDVLVIAEERDRKSMIDALASAGIALSPPEAFEPQRIASFWPQSGREILEKSIPQELDRDHSAISFTKGCYLGQETIARLDAIGQLQKKLCCVRIDSREPVEPGTAVMKADQQIGQITSASLDPSGRYVIALAYLRRGNFESGLPITCNGVKAVVL
jgi:folate-binding protein YgfZ